MNFFQHHPQVLYKFANSASQFNTLVITDITTRAEIMQRIQQITNIYYDYIVADYERPDTVAVSVYGHTRYTWLILLLNNMFGLYDWPLNYDAFQRYITAKYGSLERAQTITTDAEYYFDASHTYVTAATYATLTPAERGVSLPARYCFTTAGAPIDSATYETLTSAEKGIVQTPYEYEHDQNEQKRRIKFVNGRLLPAIDREYRKLFRD